MASNDNEIEETSEVGQPKIEDKSPLLYDDVKGNWIYPSIPVLRIIYKDTIVNSLEKQADVIKSYNLFSNIWPWLTTPIILIAPWFIDPWAILNPELGTWSTRFVYVLVIFSVIISVTVTAQCFVELYIQHVVLKGLPKTQVPFTWKQLLDGFLSSLPDLNPYQPRNAVDDFFLMLLTGPICIFFTYFAFISGVPEQIVTELSIPSEHLSETLIVSSLILLSLGLFVYFLKSFLNKFRVKPTKDESHNETEIPSNHGDQSESLASIIGRLMLFFTMTAFAILVLLGQIEVDVNIIEKILGGLFGLIFAPWFTYLTFQELMDKIYERSPSKNKSQ